MSLGIDFGTSTTVAARYREGHVEVLTNPQGQEVTPSCVAFPPNGVVAIGHEAKQRRGIDPKNALYSVKRILGRNWEHTEVQSFADSYPFQLERGSDGKVRFDTRAGKLTPVEITSYLLAAVREAPALEAEEIGNVTLTVPTTASREQRLALREAAANAGYPHVRIMEEPCAAALAHLRGHDDEQVVVVYDLGGGTFDLTVLRWSGAEMQVLGEGGDVYSDYDILGAGGDSYLGGDDIDLNCANWVCDQVLESFHWDLHASDTSFQKLLFACEKAKKLLCVSDQQKINLGNIDPALRGRSLELSSSVLEKLCAAIVGRTFIICDETLAAAGIAAREVDTIVLSGGGCHMPAVQRGGMAYFGKQPVMTSAPDRAVAIGAALHAGRSA